MSRYWPQSRPVNTKRWYRPLVLLALSLVGVERGQAQSGSSTQFEISPLSGSPIIQVSTRIAPFVSPKWCSSDVVAFENSNDGRWQIEFYKLPNQTPTIENIDAGSGNLFRCGSGGDDQLGIKNQEEGYESVGSFYLLTRPNIVTLLQENSTFLSSDAKLRTFTFGAAKEYWQSQFPKKLTLVQVAPNQTAAGPPFRIHRSQIQSGTENRQVLISKVSPDGSTIASLDRTADTSRHGSDLSGIDLVVSPVAQRATKRVAVSELLSGAARVDSIFFDAETLVVTGATERDKITVATCAYRRGALGNCRSSQTNIDATRFSTVAAREGGFVFASSEWKLDSNPALRACLFQTTSLETAEPPINCYMRGASLPLPIHMGPIALFSIAPGGEYVAVRTRFRDRSGSSDSQWSVFPMSSFRIR